MKEKETPVDESFSDGCCYNNNPRPELNCNKVKCCYLVRHECILMDKNVEYY